MGAGAVGIGVGAVVSPFDSPCGAISSSAMSSSCMAILTAMSDSYCSSSLSLAASTAGLSYCSNFLADFVGDGVMKSEEGMDVVVGSECRQVGERMYLCQRELDAAVRREECKVRASLSRECRHGND